MGRGAWAGILLLAAVAGWGWMHREPAAASAQGGASGQTSAQAAASASWPAYLPPEALDTLDRIGAGGPFDHRQDGAVFQNRESLLPEQPAGYYREYTVETPGSSDRGARRIVAGGDPPVEFFYTDDHYRSFRRFEAGGSR